LTMCGLNRVRAAEGVRGEWGVRVAADAPHLIRDVGFVVRIEGNSSGSLT